MEGALDHLVAREFHIVAEVVEAELVVGGVGDVRIISGAALLVGKVGNDHSNGHSKESVDLAHPVCVTAGEIIVDGDDVDALPFERVQIDGERGDERLSLARLHFGDLAPVKRDPADQLDIIMTLAERSDRRLAHRREGLRDEVVELLAAGQALAKDVGLPAQLLVGEGGDIGFEPVDRIDIFAEAADVAIVGRSEDAFCHCGEHRIPLNTRAFRKGENLSPTLWETVAGDVRSGLAVVN